MDELISALLNLSRITRLEITRQPIDLTQMAQVTSDDALEGRDRQKFQISIQPGMALEADPKLIRVVLDNLIRNAIKFSTPSTPSKIDVGQDAEGFYVRDNGVGFNPAYAEKLFVAFERLHTQSEFPGSGIGLATVFRIIQKHGGNVWAKSEEGQGAVFYFTVR
jgi:signal transduction histidine kinase